MRSLLTWLVCVSAMASPVFASPADNYQDLREEIWQWRLDNSPILATNIGDRRGDGQLGDWSEEGHKRAIEDAADFAERLGAIDPEDLGPDLAIDHAVIPCRIIDPDTTEGHPRAGAVIMAIPCAAMAAHRRCRGPSGGRR